MPGHTLYLYMTETTGYWVLGSLHVSSQVPNMYCSLGKPRKSLGHAVLKFLCSVIQDTATFIYNDWTVQDSAFPQQTAN